MQQGNVGDDTCGLTKAVSAASTPESVQSNHVLQKLPPLQHLSTGYLPPKPTDRVVALVDHALLERDDRVVGDVDLFGADLGATLVDVAHEDAGVLIEIRQPVA